MLSKSQINRLGERLRKDLHEDADLELLDTYRTSFEDAQERVLSTLRDLGLEAVGRIAKTTPSIVAKLKRGTIMLAKIQDIAGCRVIMENIAEQDRVGALVTHAFPSAKLVDRRQKPSHGYRAVHIIVETDGKLVEVQVRTELQHLWASLSEGWANAVDHFIKYGGGPEDIQAFLQTQAQLVAETPERALSLQLIAAGGTKANPAVMERIRSSTIRAVVEDDITLTRERLNLLMYNPVGNVTDELVEVRHRIYHQPDFVANIGHLLCLQSIEIRQRNLLTPETLAKLANIPTLIIWGIENPFGDVPEARKMHADIPGSRLELFEECGHWPQHEQAARYNALALSFLNSVQDSSTPSTPN